MAWTVDDIGDLAGRRAIVTGANAGLGLVTAQELARHGASVVLACRNQKKGRAAAESIQQAVPSADITLGELDLADLESIRAFAATIEEPLDILINNAGVMGIPHTRTTDGFEMQIGTNHLGHFVLTALLVPKLQQANGSRIVTVSSFLSQLGRSGVLDRGPYSGWGVTRWKAYCDSKLANVTFALELDRRARLAGSGVRSIAAHPGYCATDLLTTSRSKVEDMLWSAVNRMLAQSPNMGVMPILFAATAPEAEDGRFYGPDGVGQLRGHPREVPPPAPARRQAVRDWLWTESVRLTGVEPRF